MCSVRSCGDNSTIPGQIVHLMPLLFTKKHDQELYKVMSRPQSKIDGMQIPMAR